MANLSEKRTDGTPAWKYYIQNNENWRKLELQIETGKQTYLFEAKGSSHVEPTKKLLQAGTKLFLVENKTTKIQGIEYAKVKTSGQTGLVPINKIRKPSKAGQEGTTKDEEVAIHELDRLIKSAKRPITIAVLKPYGGIFIKIPDCIGCTKVSGTPKADFVINTKSGGGIWISHKKEGGAKAFQQYSGVSTTAGEKIYNHPEVQNFLRKTTAYIERNKLTSPLWRPVKDDLLKNYSIFGPNYSTSTSPSRFGIDNVQVIGQGKPILKEAKSSDYYTLEWSDKYHINGTASGFKDEYLPVLFAVYKEGRGFDIDGNTYRGARIGIGPFALMGGRTGLEKI